MFHQPYLVESTGLILCLLYLRFRQSLLSRQSLRHLQCLLLKEKERLKERLLLKQKKENI